MGQITKNIIFRLKLNKIIIVIIILSFGFSLFYSFYFRIKPAVDARAYDNIAWNIVTGFGYKEDAGLLYQYDNAITRVGPLYEYFLAGIYKIFGHKYGPIWVAQALLHALTAWLIYLAAILIFKDNEHQKKIGIWAAAIVGFYPDLVEISAMLLTETMYLFLFCLFLYLFFRFFDQFHWLPMISLGAVFGLAVLARPPVLFLLPIVLFYFYQKKQVLAGLFFGLALLFIFTPWTVRNYQVYNEFMPFGAAGAYNFWIGNYHGADGEQSPTQIHADFASSHSTKAIQAESIYQFKKFVREYPGEFVKLTFLRINKYFSVIRPMGFWFYQHGLGQALFVFSSAIFSFFVLIFSLAGAIAAFKEKKGPLKYLLAFTVATPLILFITVVETRYRFQIYPLFAILAGYFVFWLAEQVNWHKNKVLWLALAVVFFNGVLDLFLSLNKLKEKIGGFF